MKKLDIMRKRDGEGAWDMVNGKVTRVKEKVEKKQPHFFAGDDTEDVKENKLDKKIKVHGPRVKEGIKEVIVKKYGN